jgi:hypothetical protein
MFATPKEKNYAFVETAGYQPTIPAHFLLLVQLL